MGVLSIGDVRDRTHNLILGLCSSLVLLACAGGPTVRDFAPVDPISFDVQLVQTGLRSMADVTMVTRSPVGGRLADPLEVAVPSRWAGFSDHRADLTDFSARDGEGNPLDLIWQNDVIRIHHDDADQVHISYRVSPSARTLTRHSRFHSLGTAEYFFAYGRNLFLRPLSVAEPSVITARFRTTGSGSRWAATLGPVDSSIEVRAPWLGLADAAYIGGRPRIVHPSSSGDRVTLIVDPTLRPVEDDALNTLQRIESVTAGLFGPTPLEGTVAIVLRRDDDPMAATGTGRPGGIVLELGERTDPGGADVARLIAHEHLHRYVGGHLRFAESDALETLWFKEGAVEYLAAQIAVRCGAAPKQAFFDALSGAVTGYLSNPQLGEAVTGSADGAFWNAATVRRFPYDQGFLLSFWLDMALRREGGSLDRVVAGLVADWGGRHPVSASQLEAHLAQESGLELASIFDTHVRTGRPIPVRQWLGDANLSLSALTQDAAYYGIEVDVSRTGVWHVVSIDPAGPASRLPVRAGDQLVEPPHFPAGSGHGRPAELYVNRDGQRMRLRVPPSPGERRVWQIRAEDESFDQLMSW